MVEGNSGHGSKRRKWSSPGGRYGVWAGGSWGVTLTSSKSPVGLFIKTGWPAAEVQEAHVGRAGVLHHSAVCNEAGQLLQSAPALANQVLFT